uniref:Ig-like domain-containing protein n=1 Tax=Latimeria chalumnae TaxID=7897 RepID=H3AH79_LATCH
LSGVFNYLQHQFFCAEDSSTNASFCRWLVSYDSRKLFYLDSRVNRFVPLQQFLEKKMEEKNSNKLTFQQYNSICQLACEYKEQMEYKNPFIIGTSKVPPMVNIGIMKDEEIQTDTLSLICSIRGFYPQAISTTWLRNGEDIKSETFTTGLLPNVDKTFSLDLYVDIVESDWNEYTCQVEHSGLTEPL